MIKEDKIIKSLKSYEPVIWFNEDFTAKNESEYGLEDIKKAEALLDRFKVFLEDSFEFKGMVESDLIELKGYKEPYKVFLKADHALPISGSIKARGGIYAVLKYAEDLLLGLGYDIDYKNISQYKDVLSNYEIVVSSTGNLGLSIGIISRKLGFKVKVHMSHDAMEWKKNKLRMLGATVIEHQSDYSQAVIEGRKSLSENSYFIDDENSVDLFMGYAVAAIRLKKQLKEMNINISKESPLFVYLPCGVGGGPGGITFGLNLVFDNVHCFLSEPTHSPCMLLGLYTKTHDKYSVTDLGLDNITVADGLAVGRASKFVGKIINSMVAGISTSSDITLYKYIKRMTSEYNIYQEPSAVIGFKTFDDVIHSEYKEEDIIKNGYHIIWSTGGNMVPDNILHKYLERGYYESNN